MGTKEQADLVRYVFKLGSLIKNYKSYIFNTIKIALLSIMLLAIALVAIDRWISAETQDQLYFSVEDVEPHNVAVVLGTSKYLGKVLNEYYIHRIDAAIDLYQQDKISNFLLSGDNAHRSYNEPWTMKRDLLRAEIPEEHIFLDYAGFRTLDSVVRAKEIFDTDNFLIISQQFHCERALFIANFHDIKAKCLAVSGPTKHSGYKVRIREVFARAKAVLDLYITQAKPKFLGPKEPISADEKSSDNTDS
ncbi:SanA/YdcF family protein [Vibrio taketomensis]|uniref:SanA/YdcF family protein n=1 Tax=Vibrio taketomensis TaxID=2572923 RepID=UPI00138997E4|nr:ElyC/SanA/YdcF family protein [Vibrio taketomensis]